MADADDRPAGKHPFQRRDLHRGYGDVAERHGQDANADPQVIGPGERGRGGADAAFAEAVLPEQSCSSPAASAA